MTQSNVIPMWKSSEEIRHAQAMIYAEFDAELIALARALKITVAPLRDDMEALSKLGGDEDTLRKVADDRLLAKRRARHPQFSLDTIRSLAQSDIALAISDANHAAGLTLRDALRKRNHRLQALYGVAKRSERFTRDEPSSAGVADPAQDAVNAPLAKKMNAVVMLAPSDWAPRAEFLIPGVGVFHPNVAKRQQTVFSEEQVAALEAIGWVRKTQSV